MDLSFEQLTEIVNSGNFDELIGHAENTWLECKREPYQLTHDKDKLELVKDVVSLANAEGGYLLIGVRTEQNPESQADVVKAIRPFSEKLVKCQQYLALVKSWSYPTIEKLNVSWKKVTTEKRAIGVVVVTIPKQAESRKPFLIVREVLSSGRRTEIVFGYVERKGDISEPLKVAELHQHLRDGRNYSTRMATRFDALQAQIKIMSQTESSEPEITVDVEPRIHATLDAAGMRGRRAIVLTARPVPATTLQTLFLPSESSHGVVWKLEHPPTIRANGWSLETFDQATFVEGKLRRVTYEDRSIVDLYRDGTLVFAGSADPGMLSQYSRGRIRGAVTINSIALVESIVNFFAFYLDVIDDMETPAGKHEVRVDICNFNQDNQASVLMPYTPNSESQRFGDELHAAPHNDWTHAMSFLTEELQNYPSAAYQLVKEIYYWFGMENTKIPYVTERDGKSVIDTEAIAKI